jgi:hypothetical protein
VLTNSQDATADFLGRKLDAQGVAYARLNTDRFIHDALLTATEADACLYLNGDRFTPESFSHVWQRHPEKLNLGPNSDEAKTVHIGQEWSAALQGWLARIPIERWINHPANNAAASYKVEQLWRARRFGLNVPPTLVTQSRDEARKFYEDRRKTVIVKPVHGGYVERNSGHADTVVYTHAIDPSEILLFPSGKACPALLQERVKKRCDVRITLVDQHLHAVALTAKDAAGEQRLDIRRNQMSDVSYAAISVPADVGTALRRYVASYGLRFAALDMAIDDAGQWVFFELNPNGQWAWLDQSGASDIAGSLIATFIR